MIKVMKNIPQKFVLSIKPKEYLIQGPSHCGVYAVKAILSAFNLDKKGHPKEYHSNWFGKLTGLTLGRQYLVEIFKSHGIEVERRSLKNFSDEEKLNLLKTLLSKNYPVMIRIGNGYYHSNKYNSILGKLVVHWISLWGYDDQEQIFYVYDSGMLKKYWKENIPVGNTIRSYKEILRDWNFGAIQFWAWPFSGRDRNLYIEIKGR